MKRIFIQARLTIKTAYFWQRLLVFSASLFLTTMFSRLSNDLFSTIFLFIAVLSGIWLILSLFKKGDTQMIGKKPIKPFWVRLVAMVTLVPALVVLAPALGFGLGLAINPYTAQELVANEAREEAEKKEREAREAAEEAEKLEREARKEAEQLEREAREEEEKLEREAREEEEKLEREAAEEAEKLEAEEKAKRDELEQAAKELEQAEKKEEERLANICDSPEVKDSLKSQDELDSYDARPFTDRENWLGWNFENPEVFLYPWCFGNYFVREYERQWDMEANWDRDPNYVYERFGVQRKP